MLHRYSEEFQKLLDEEHEKAKAEGKAEGMAEGKAESKAEVVRKMASLNYAIEEIINITGCGDDEVRKIISSNI